MHEEDEAAQLPGCGEHLFTGAVLGLPWGINSHGLEAVTTYRSELQTSLIFVLCKGIHTTTTHQDKTAR